MKKLKSTKRSSAPKGTASAADVGAYQAALPNPARAAFIKLRAAIRTAAPPDASETISYGIPAIKDRKVLVWFAAFSDHCSFFPTAAVIDLFREEMKKFSTSKGTVRFPLDKPLPIALIKRMVKTRVALSRMPKRAKRGKETNR